MSRKREPNPAFETPRDESVPDAPDGPFDDDLTLFDDLAPFDGGEQVPEPNVSFPDQDDFLFYDRLTFDAAPENDFYPPEPQEPPEIDLTAYEKPDPADYREPDPECDLDYTPNVAVKADLTLGLSDSFGFGGHNACLAFRKI